MIVMKYAKIISSAFHHFCNQLSSRAMMMAMMIKHFCPSDVYTFFCLKQMANNTILKSTIDIDDFNFTIKYRYHKIYDTD